MSLWGGFGGAVTMTAGNTAWAVGKWTLEKGVALPNATNSTSGGIKQRKATIKNQMVTFELPWDDTVNPEASGWTEGTEVKVVLNLGSSGKKFTSNKVLIEKCTYVNDEDEDLVRLTVVGYANEAFVYS